MYVFVSQAHRRFFTTQVPPILPLTCVHPQMKNKKNKGHNRIIWIKNIFQNTASKWITITWTRIIRFIRRYHYFSQAWCDWLPLALPSPLQVLFCHRRRVSRPGCQLLAWAKMCFKCCCRLVMRRAACQAAGLWRQMRESVVKKQAFAWARARI